SRYLIILKSICQDFSNKLKMLYIFDFKKFTFNLWVGATRIVNIIVDVVKGWRTEILPVATSSNTFLRNQIERLEKIFPTMRILSK
ncbi:MAG: hypothetical protein ACFE9L_16345, partial [Candidatus Hodarchaeota archaeon]